MKTEPNESAHRIVGEQAGLTKREHFAAMALQGLLANNYVIEQYTPDFIPVFALIQADALIGALNSAKTK